MNLTEEQKALYRAVADGKRVEYMPRDESKFFDWHVDDSPALGFPGIEWRIAPETITITIPRPKELEQAPIHGNLCFVTFDTEADAQAFIDAVRGAK